ncbi:hypothetical protein [Pontibacter sp. G13]|uniref:hypothetical protein n=1 Tax=Pontibacter sp. G13 TaxID=3074898 RepID=UPI00288BA09C|nr:hypothetical protein [Pontibacter sp. G13]WNJ16032.1 hypothetical protein RJD25_14310 [Pontibacter sp. G13]
MYKSSIFCISFALICFGMCWGCSETPVARPEPEYAYLNLLNAYDQAEDGIDIRLSTFGATRQMASELSVLSSWPGDGHTAITLPEDTAGDLYMLLYDSDADTLLHDTVYLDRGVYDLTPDEAFSMTLVSEQGRASLVKIEDGLLELSGNTSAYRFLNLAQSFSSVSLVSSREGVTVPRKGFLTYSSFDTLSAQSYNFYFVDDFTNQKIDSISNLDLQPRQHYSFFLTMVDGVPTGSYALY